MARLKPAAITAGTRNGTPRVANASSAPNGTNMSTLSISSDSRPVVHVDRSNQSSQSSTPFGDWLP